MTPPRPTRVLLVDNNQFARAGLKSLLDSVDDIEVVGESRNGASAADAARTLNPQVVLVNVDLPDMTGYEACQLLLEAAPDVKVITMADTIVNEDVTRSMMARARGHLMRNGPVSDFIDTVRANGRGAMYLIPEVVEVSRKFWDAYANPAEIASLSAREKQIVMLIAEGYNNTRIGLELEISPHTVRTHIRRIQDKLDLHSRLKLAAYAGMLQVLDAKLEGE
jgi:two-component system response regulator NreC